MSSPVEDDDPLARMIETEKHFLVFHKIGLNKVATSFLFPFAWLIPSFVSAKALEYDQFLYNYGLTSLVGGSSYKFLGHDITNIYPLLTLIDSHPFTGKNSNNWSFLLFYSLWNSFVLLWLFCNHIAFSWFTFSQSGKLDVTVAAAPDLFSDDASVSRMTSHYFQTELEKLCVQCGISKNTSASIPNNYSNTWRLYMLLVNTIDA